MLNRVFLAAASLLLSVAVCRAGLADGDADLATVLQAWERSAQAIQSYDVFLRVDETYVLEPVLTRKEDPERGTPPAFEFRKRTSGSAPTNTHFTRQVLSKEGKRRYELIPVKDKSWTEARVFDGEVVRGLTPKTGFGIVKARGPNEDEFTPFYSSYAALYRDLPYGGSFFRLLRTRKGTRLVKPGLNDRDCVVVESPPEKGGDYPNFGWRVKLDPTHVMLPIEIELYRGSMKSREVLTRIQGFREVEAGIWAPVEATHAHEVRGETIATGKVVVELDRSSWNQPVSEELFTLPFPVGTRVRDEAHNLIYVTGKPDTAKNIDALLEGARKAHPIRPPAPPEPATGWKAAWLPLLIASNVLAGGGLFLGAYLWARGRRQRREG